MPLPGKVIGLRITGVLASMFSVGFRLDLDLDLDLDLGRTSRGNLGECDGASFG
ncbi:uncharacterized protein UV8b_08033 [Ustilaginoidea virens]|uniref:Uncharacterized protein n=1 Tax=Ustilaginoidea virens TaxID=1159556 RepID=A0A8E5ML22_USTVR|nr:uncharacterized protein UV8b_08033 [Ustilaginoidea virens]QUC23792.1 hypothetical protein UV8b_08033 [Ustilaginoidea virens]